MAQCEQCRAEIPPDGDACPACGSLAPRVPDELIGRELLGRYRIVRLLAEGGMGRVYLAEQTVGTVVRRVAVKVLRRQLGDDRQLVSRFAREAETLVRLTHPNTVQLFDFGALPDGTLALVMEYVEGHSLARELAHGPLPLARAERLLAQIGGALKEAHAHGIVHRDLKPDNLLIAERAGHGDFVKVLDFGIAKVSAADDTRNTKLTQQGMIIGTPPYMSPEQFSGEPVDARSDVYSLAVIVYEMLTGTLPFVANTPWEWASRHLTAEPAPLPLDATRALSPGHAAAVRRALAKRPEDRPQNVDEFLALFAGGAAPFAGVETRARAHERNDAGVRDRSSDDALTPSTPSGTATSSLRPRLARRAALGFGAMAGLALLAAVVSLRAGSSASRPAAPEPPAILPAIQAGTGPNLPAPLPAGRSTPELEAPDAPAPRAHRSASVGGASSTRSHARRDHGRSEEAAPSPPPAPVALDREQAAPDRTPEQTPAAQVEARAGSRERNDEDGASTSPRPRAESSSTPSARTEATTPPTPAPPNPTAPAAARVEPTRRPAAGEGRTSTPAAAATPSVPGDLQQRITQIQGAAGSRLEVAVGLYQAAAGKYGSHPALQGVRAELARAAEPRLKTLLSQGRCAQAQALQRALTAISAASATKGLFGQQCRAP